MQTLVFTVSAVEKKSTSETQPLNSPDQTYLVISTNEQPGVPHEGERKETSAEVSALPETMQVKEKTEVIDNPIDSTQINEVETNVSIILD